MAEVRAAGGGGEGGEDLFQVGVRVSDGSEHGGVGDRRWVSGCDPGLSLGSGRRRKKPWERSKFRGLHLWVENGEFWKGGRREMIRASIKMGLGLICPVLVHLGLAQTMVDLRAHT